jgi:hypothetical protein
LFDAALEEAGRNLQQLGVFKRVDMLLNELPEVRLIYSRKLAFIQLHQLHPSALE